MRTSIAKSPRIVTPRYEHASAALYHVDCKSDEKPDGNLDEVGQISKNNLRTPDGGDGDDTVGCLGFLA